MFKSLEFSKKKCGSLAFQQEGAGFDPDTEGGRKGGYQIFSAIFSITEVIIIVL